MYYYIMSIIFTSVSLIQQLSHCIIVLIIIKNNNDKNMKY